MQKFLEKIVETLLKNHPKGLESIGLILPSKRAGTFLLHALSKQLTNSGFAPQIFSLADFVEQQSDLVVIEPTELLLELFEVHQQIEGKEAEPFEQFMNWGNTLIQDFNEIDRYLIDGHELFTFLTEAKALEQWNLDGQQLSNFQQNYLHFWRKLATYYERFQAKLKNEGKAYSGMQFRRLAESEHLPFANTTSCNYIYVAGFNAFSEAEKRLLKKLEQLVHVEYLWDSDRYYIDDSSQEAGMFLRKEKAKRASFSWVFDDLLKSEKKINVYQISGNIGQAKTVGSLLNEMKDQADIDETAVVLADEGLLMPVLESLGEHLSDINITMGCTVKQSYLFDYFDSYLQLLLAQENENQKDKNITSFYYLPLIKFLQHPLQHEFPQSFVKATKQLVEDIKKENLLWVPLERLNLLNTLLQINLFDKNPKPTNVLDRLLEITALFMSHFHQKNKPYELEYLAHFKQQFERLHNFQTQKNILKSLKDLQILYSQMIADAEVSFVGEPLKGLQIMGVLESRLLDFKNVIICSLNEGLLPAGKNQNSFIPFDIKHKYGLPSYKEKDAIYAYHFYRLLQRSCNVHLLYNTKLDQFYGSERSRFLEQILYELPKKNTNVTLTEVKIENALTEVTERNEKIVKTEKSIEKVKKHWQAGLSASALNTFLTCPKNYYFKYIIGLKGEDSVEENIEASTFGSILHDALENLYLPTLNQPLGLQTLAKIKKQSREVLENQYTKHMQFKPQFGAHRLALEAAHLYLKNVISIDEKVVKSGKELIIRFLEKEFTRNYTLGLETLPQICLKGKIDRIDEVNGQSRIIDYKSGAVTPAELNAKKENILMNGKKPKMIQLMFYLLGLGYENSSFQAGIISMKNASTGFIPLQVENTAESMHQILLQTASNLLESSIAFEHDEKSNYCDYC